MLDFVQIILEPTKYEAFTHLFFERLPEEWLPAIEQYYQKNSAFFPSPPKNFQLVTQAEIQSVLIKNRSAYKRFIPDFGVKFICDDHTLYCPIEVEVEGNYHCLKQSRQYNTAFMTIITGLSPSFLKLAKIQWVYVLSFQLNYEIALDLAENRCPVLQVVTHPYIDDETPYIDEIEPQKGGAFDLLARAIRNSLAFEELSDMLKSVSFTALEKYIIAGFFYKCGDERKMEKMKTEISVLELKELRKETVEKFPPHLVHLLSPDALSGLTAEQLEHLTPQQIKQLPPAVIEQITPTQIASLSKEKKREFFEILKREFEET